MWSSVENRDKRKEMKECTNPAYTRFERKHGLAQGFQVKDRGCR